MTMTHSKCNANHVHDTEEATLTPLTSTRDAPFVIQVEQDENNNSNNHVGSTSSLAQKLRTKTALQSVPEARSVRAASNESTQSQKANSLDRGEWTASLVGCLDCRECSNFAMLACCPCLPAAKVHGMLGSSFESGVLYFAGLVFGILISLGLCFSNSSNSVSDPTASSNSTISAGKDRDVEGSTQMSTSLYGNLALVLVVLFLVGVAFLRTRTRQRFNIPGSRTVDCLLSFACCWCVLSQAQSHFEKYNAHEFGLDTPTDTLPAYA